MAKRARDDWFVSMHTGSDRKVRKVARVLYDSDDDSIGVVIGVPNGNDKLDGEVLRIQGNNVQIGQHVDGKAVGLASRINDDGKLHLGTWDRRVIDNSYVTFGSTRLEMRDAGGRSLYQDHRRIRHTTADGRVAHGDVGNGFGRIEHPPPKDDTTQMWTTVEEGKWQNGTLVSGYRLKKDRRGFVYRFDAGGTLLREEDDVALAQKMTVFAEMIDAQAEEIKALRKKVESLSGTQPPLPSPKKEESPSLDDIP